MAEERELAKKEVSPVEAFKFQNTLFQQFGEDGVKVYASMGEHRSAGDLMTATGISESRLLEIIEFMDKNGMIEIKAAGEKPTEMPPVPELPPEAPEVPELPAAPEEKEEVLSTEELEGKKRMAKAERGKVLEIEEEKPEEEEAPKKAAAPEEEELSPFEKVVFDKFGKIGLRVYSLIDGEKTAEEILSETGISEVQLVEILEFMDKQGIIKLEKPSEEEEEEEEKEEEEMPEMPGPLLEEKGLPFPGAPGMAGALLGEEEASEDAIPIDVPIRQRISAVSKLTMEAEMVAKFGSKARRLHSAVDNRKDTVRLALETGMPFEEMDEVLAFLGERSALVFATLANEDVRERYGAEGEAIYRKYGRDGVLFYELIGQVKSFRDMVAFSRMPGEKAADVFLFIHEVLKIETPLNRDMLLKEAGK